MSSIFKDLVCGIVWIAFLVYEGEHGNSLDLANFWSELK